ncbi:inner-Membrane translocator protein [Arthrobacter sp. Hiyo6]|nr:inner-Membrane translocator protein [Arthrobacter sp. Hiyo6]
MSALRESLGFLTSRLRQVGIFVALILIVLLFQGLTEESSWSRRTSPTWWSRTATSSFWRSAW